MKELTIEQKAKAYDEAIKRASKLRVQNPFDTVSQMMEHVFPELKESEDERVRNKLIEFFKGYSPDEEWWGNITQEDILAWLEKQGEQKPIDKIQLGKKYKCIASPRYSTFRRGNIYKPVDNFLCNLMNLCYECFEPIEDSEQKPADKIESKFKVGDWVVSSVLGTAHIIGVNDSNEYQLEYIDGKQKFSSIDYVNYEYDEWTIADAKDGDVLADDTIEGYSSPFVALYKKIDEECDFESYCFVGFDGKFYKGENGHSTEEIHPATKEQRDILFAKIKEAGYEWDENNKMLKEIVEDEEEPQNYKNQIMSEITDLVKHYIKQKPTCGEAGEDMKEALRTEYEKGRADAFAQMQKEWSEEDECTLNGILDDYKSMCKTYRNWLESLKNRIQPQQKPTWSDEDVYNFKLILSTINQDQDLSLETKNKLSSWLKSLKERYFWKPKTWEIQILESVIEKGENPKNYSVTLHLILEQLKKLKGE